MPNIEILPYDMSSTLDLVLSIGPIEKKLPFLCLQQNQSIGVQLMLPLNLLGYITFS